MQIDVGQPVTTGRRRTELRRRTAITVAAGLSLFVFGTLASPARTAAASGTELYNGTVECLSSSSAHTTTVTFRAAHIEHSLWKGTFKTWTYVQYSWDSSSWTNWFPLAPQTWPIDVGGASYALAQNFTVAFQPAVLYIRAWTAYEFYDVAGRQIGGTTWLLRDSYSAWWDNQSWIYRSTATGSCSIPKAS
jgi:hypothetical protein